MQPTRPPARNSCQLSKPPGPPRSPVPANWPPRHSRATVAVFRQQPDLHEEIFGPATLLVACRDLAEMRETITLVEGQLTATVHQAGDDLAGAADLLALLEQRAGRLIFDGSPSGVEVCPAMVHSGPWPATTDSRFTSVGTGAILRWVRPVCWQDAPATVLPVELRDPAAHQGEVTG